MTNEKISIDKERCQLCGQCVEVCSRSNIRLGEEAAYIRNPDRCMLCGHCKSICPEDAPQLHALDALEFELVPDKGQIPNTEMLMTAFRTRRSTRIFKKRAVPVSDLEKLIQAGRFAPTGGNRQPVQYTVIYSQEMIDRARTLTHDYLFGEADKILKAKERHEKYGDPLPPRADIRLGYAPLWQSFKKMYGRGKDLLFHFAPSVIVLHLNPENASPFCADAGLAAMQMVLMAETLGLGTCFCGFLTTTINNSPELKQTLQIPEENNAILSFMVGYPDVSYLRIVSRHPAKVLFI